MKQRVPFYYLRPEDTAWRPYDDDPTELLLAAVRGERPFGALRAGLGPAAGWVLRVDVGNGRSLLWVVLRDGEIALAPLDGAALCNLRHRAPPPGSRVENFYLLWELAPPAHILPWCENVVRARRAARACLDAAAASLALPADTQRLYALLDKAGPVVLREAVYDLVSVRPYHARSVERPEPGKDPVRCFEIALTIHAAAVAGQRPYVDLVHGPLRPVDEFAEVVRWASAACGDAGESTARAAVQRAVPLWAFVAGLAGVPEDEVFDRPLAVDPLLDD